MPKNINKFYFLEKSSNEGKTTYIFRGTKEVVDRDGDIVKVDGIDFTNFEKNPVVLYIHSYRKFPIGKVLNYKVEGDEVLFEIDIADETQDGKEARYLIDNGYMRTVSIGFIVKEVYDRYGYWGKKIEDLEKDYPDWYQNKMSEIAKADRVFTKIELLEISLVPVPANQDATLIMASKGMKTACMITKDYETNECKLIEFELPEVKNAVRYSEHPDNMKVDTESAWDKASAVKSLRKWASTDGSGEKDKMIWSKYRKGFGWYDANDLENFGSYKYPHHKVVDGDFYVVWRGVVSAMVFLDRGDIPAEDRKSLYNHLAKHYRDDFGKEPPEYKEKGRTLEEAIKEYDEIHLEEYLKMVDVNELKDLLQTLEQKIADVEKEKEELEAKLKELEGKQTEKKEEEEIRDEKFVEDKSNQEGEQKDVSPSSEEEVEVKETSESDEEVFELPDDMTVDELKAMIKQLYLKRINGGNE